jgi:hypothetical protein
MEKAPETVKVQPENGWNVYRHDLWSRAALARGSAMMLTSCCGRRRRSCTASPRSSSSTDGVTTEQDYYAAANNMFTVRSVTEFEKLRPASSYNETWPRTLRRSHKVLTGAAPHQRPGNADGVAWLGVRWHVICRLGERD